MRGGGVERKSGNLDASTELSCQRKRDERRGKKRLDPTFRQVCIVIHETQGLN